MMKEKIKKLRKTIVGVSNQANEGHIPSAFSILDILWVLYDKILRIDPANPVDETRDRLIVSKGHSSLGIYAVLAEKGFFSVSQLYNFCKFDSILGGHPDRNKVPGIEASTGSLGHGLPMAVGLALGAKIKKLDLKIFTIIGDGECNEGTIWESLLLAAHHNLNNLICIVDYNHSTDRALKIGDLSKKFEAFGWNPTVIDGHNHQEIFNALNIELRDRPTAIIAETTKGYGCKSMENNPSWHHKSPNDEELKIILDEILSL